MREPHWEMWIYLKILTNWLKIYKILLSKENCEWLVKLWSNIDCCRDEPASPSKNLVEFYCKILYFWKSFWDFNNVSYWWISWLSKLKTERPTFNILLQFFKDFSISEEVVNIQEYKRKKLIQKVWPTQVFQMTNFSLTVYLITLPAEGPVYCKFSMVVFCDYNSIISQALNFNCLKLVAQPRRRPAKTKRFWINCFCLALCSRQVQNIQTTKLQIELCEYI